MISAPAWFHSLSIAGLSLGAVCFLIVAFDLLNHPHVDHECRLARHCGSSGNISEMVGWQNLVWSTRHGSEGKSRRTSG